MATQIQGEAQLRPQLNYSKPPVRRTNRQHCTTRSLLPSPQFISCWGANTPFSGAAFAVCVVPVLANFISFLKTCIIIAIFKHKTEQNGYGDNDTYLFSRGARFECHTSHLAIRLGSVVVSLNSKANCRIKS